MDFSNVGVSIKDIDSTVLPAVAPLLSLIENSLQDDLLCDDLCLSIKGTGFESNVKASFFSKFKPAKRAF